MKKTFFLLAVVIAIITSSCTKKDYTCTCTSNGGISKAIIPNATKSEALTICKSGEVYAQGATNTSTCVLN